MDAALLAILAVVVFGYRLADEPTFIDEWAYISQAYFADLYWNGDSNHPAWLGYAAFDLPPLPKLVIGLALSAGGYQAPPQQAAFDWYHNPKSTFGPHEMLVVAREPSPVFGALGCVAAYGLGVLVSGRRVGWLAALLLMINPLYAMHARRAMSDVPCESLMLASAFFGLWTWRRILSGNNGLASWLGALSAGVFAGLATLAKLNGGMVMFVILAWGALALVLPRIPWTRKVLWISAAVVAGVVSVATFVVLNPFMTAHPRQALPSQFDEIVQMNVWGRGKWLVTHRVSTSSGQQTIHPHNALKTPAAKLSTVAVQGFGRFGPFGPRASDSDKRYDPGQDWGLVFWIPCVLWGLGVAIALGRHASATEALPITWALVVQAVVTLIVVTAYLPLAWDRYFISLQPVSALLASLGAITAFDSLRRVARPKTNSEDA
ncbi:ArnT family glycosyltransferase [Singulisphaera rosea]